jgi:hypothetical protein
MGNLKLPGFGNASAVLYDGSSFQPYILATRGDGSNGIIYGLFSQETESFSSQGTAFPTSCNVLMFRSYSPWMDHRNQSGHLPFLDPPTSYRRLNRRTDPSRTRRLRPSSWNTSHPRSKSRKNPSVAAHKQPRRAPSGWIPLTTRMTFCTMTSSGRGVLPTTKEQWDSIIRETMALDFGDVVHVCVGCGFGK